jgi:hypothetical protein
MLRYRIAIILHRYFYLRKPLFPSLLLLYNLSLPVLCVNVSSILSDIRCAVVHEKGSFGLIIYTVMHMCSNIIFHNISYPLYCHFDPRLVNDVQNESIPQANF